MVGGSIGTDAGIFLCLVLGLFAGLLEFEVPNRRPRPCPALLTNVPRTLAPLMSLLAPKLLLTPTLPMLPEGNDCATVVGEWLLLDEVPSRLLQGDQSGIEMLENPSLGLLGTDDDGRRAEGLSTLLNLLGLFGVDPGWG
jgi:hypothetical protein